MTTTTSVYPLFRQAMEAFHIPSGSRIRVALSGGPDSTALLSLTLRFVQELRPDIRLSVGHIHHGLRGPDADADEEFCRQLADSHSLSFEVEHPDVEEYRKVHQLSLETAAREVRFRIFREWAQAEDGLTILTGHNADDQVETVLGNLCRGTGIAGLRGMPTDRALDALTRLFRPLLRFSRRDLDAYRERNGVGARHDSTNRDPAHRRNRIRHRLLPLLEKEFNPRIRRAILGLAGEASEVVQLLGERLAPWREVLQSGPDLVEAELTAIREAPPALQALLLDEAWQLATRLPTRLGRDHHRAWTDLVAGTRTGPRYHLPYGWRLERAGGWIYLLRELEGLQPAADLPVACPGTTPIPWLPARLTLSSDPGGVRLPAAWLEEGCRLRAALPEDRLALITGHAEVREILRSAGVPPSLRGRYPVLARPGQVLWIPGLKTAPRPPGQAEWFARLEIDPEHSWETHIVARLNTRPPEFEQK